MKTILRILLAFVTVTAAQADVIVYNSTVALRFIGQGSDLRIRGRGINVVDVERDESYTIIAFSIQGTKLYTVTDDSTLMDQELFSVRGPSYTVNAAANLIVSGDTTTRGFIFGKVVPLSIRPDRIVSRPRTMTSTSFAIGTPPGQEAVVAPGEAFHSFSQKATQAANRSGLDAHTVIENYRADLIARGFTESP